MMSTSLPIEHVLSDLIQTLAHDKRAVLQAPPGAGKTTQVPLSMLEAGLTAGRIVMLEPRRLAARSAAERLAQSLGETVGETVGFRVRGEARTSDKTRIEVVTEGILTRMLQADPELPGIGAVIFDEFHERSLNSDLGLALCLEVTEALRDDLILLVMSATLDAEPVAKMMQCKVVTSEGRSFDVTPHWLATPVPNSKRFDQAMTELVQKAVAETEGGVLAFLPGAREIRAAESYLSGTLPQDCVIQPLYGAMDFAAQRAAIRPHEKRKVVLATSIAETSLTIPDIRVVVDGGRARRGIYDPASGMARLVTERVTRAEATQRAGRAGRVAPGVCYKLWTKGEEGALTAFPPPEVQVGDLTRLALEIAVWGTSEEDLHFVTTPHAGRLKEARALLRFLGALDGQGKVTPHGRKLARAPLHPRLSHMLEIAGPDAALWAAILSDADPIRGMGADLTLRRRAIERPDSLGESVHRGVIATIKTEARRLGHRGKVADPSVVALAYPDRVGQRRKGQAQRYILSGGKGAIMSSADPLANSAFIVATDLDGDPREARIRQAVAITETEIETLFAQQVFWQDICSWSKRDKRVLARRQERLGALVLDDQPWTDAPRDAVARAMLEGIRQIGLRPTAAAQRLMDRAALVDDDTFPDLSEQGLMESLEVWLIPFLRDVETASQWQDFDILSALEAHLGWDNLQKLNAQVPATFVTPLGRKIPINYGDQTPGISIRLQEMFGVTRHPMVGNKPLQITLLSPAHRPIQVTSDIPGFWARSYADVRKDMRGRYPKHPWPEDPTLTDPTLRAKPRS